MGAGLDSLGAIELRNNLAAQFSMDVSATLTFDYPTIAALASHFASRLMTSTVSDLSLNKPGSKQDLGNSSTAIVNVACRHAVGLGQIINLPNKLKELLLPKGVTFDKT